MNIEDKWNEKLREAYGSLSSVSRVAYRDTYLLSNEVLSKNPVSNHLLEYFMSDCHPEPVSYLKIILKLFRYYLLSFFCFLIYLLQGGIWKVIGSRFKFAERCDELTIINTFFLVKSIVRSGRHVELYFRGMDRVLDDLGKKYVYLPLFLGANNIFKFATALKLLRRDKVTMLTEFQLLSFLDLLRLVKFILIYPWRVLGFVRKLEVYDRGIRIIRHEILDTLDHVTFHGYSRYLQGRRIVRLHSGKIKLISWYENQVIDKNLYRGLREDSEQVTIYGAQLLLYTASILNIFPDINEKKLGLIPDYIVTNGPYFMPRKTRLEYRVGPSLRYEKIFTEARNQNRGDKILVLLPYSVKETEYLLSLISHLDDSIKKNILIKAHPLNPLRHYKRLVPPRCRVVSDDIYDLFKDAWIVIGSTGGTLVEATTLGIQTIVVRDKAEPDSNFLPEYGRGIIWDEANTADELKRLIDKFTTTDKRHLSEIEDIAVRYRDLFFCRPDSETVSEAFDLS